MAAPPPPTVDIEVGAIGALPSPPAVLNYNLIAYVTAINEGFTVLPGALIEDITSTDTAAIYMCQSCAIDLINSLTPDGSNPWLLTKLGTMYGVEQGVGFNTSVFIVFTGTVNFFIPKGFIMTDGAYQYVCQDGGVIESGGSSQPLFFLATVTGSWPVPADTVSTLVTSVPLTITLSATNPLAGISSLGPQTEESYRSQVMQAGLSPAIGFTSLLKTLLYAVPGVQPNLVSVVQIDGGGWEVICGGGDPYAIGAAILTSGIDISTLVGSTIEITGITNANPGVVTTNLNHGLITGQSNVHIAGVVGMTGVNGGPYTITKHSANTFSFGVDTTSAGAYVSGGVVTPNARNVSVNITDYPDTYAIPFVIPPSQPVIVQLTWNTDSPNLVSPSAISQLSAPAIAAYFNGLTVGAPVNLFQLDDVFKTSVASVLIPEFVSRLVWTVTINGVEGVPVSGTSLIYGDPESYFTATTANVTVTQG